METLNIIRLLVMGMAIMLLTVTACKKGNDEAEPYFKDLVHMLLTISACTKESDTIRRYCSFIKSVVCRCNE